jgi:hypothetical protein
MKTTNHKVGYFLLSLTGSLLFAASISAQTLNGCADKVSGGLRRIIPPAECKANEMPVNWSIQGPQGPQGVQGVKGTTGETGPAGEHGPQGEAGFSSAYSYASPVPPDFCHNCQSEGRGIIPMAPYAESPILASLSVPQGQYVVQAKLDVYADGAYRGMCSLSTGPNIGYPTPSDLVDRATFRGFLLDGFLPVTLQGTVSLAVAGPIELRCANLNFFDPESLLFYSYLKLTAIRVNQVVTQ